MKALLLFLSCLIFFVTATPITQNMSKVDIIIDQDFDDDLNCDPDLSSKIEYDAILTNIKGYLQSIMRDTLKPDEGSFKLRCKDATEFGMTIQGRPPALKKPGGSGGIIDVTKRPLIPRCEGSLKMIVENKLIGSSDTKVLTNIKLTGWKYGHLLKPLSRKRNFLRSVLKVQTEGNCCWKIFSQSRYRGETEFLHPGFDEAPRNKIKSAKKMECN